MADEDQLRLEQLLAKAQQMVGFDTYHIVGVPFPAAVPCGSLVLASSWPADFLTHYNKHRWFEHDAFVKAIQRNARAVPVEQVLAIARTDVVLKQRFDARLAVLGREYVGVPMIYRGARRGAVVFSRASDSFAAEERDLLQLMAPALHAAASAPPGASPASPLTARERECLGWASLGKTAGEIGDELNISESTAVAHLNAAVRKLDAVSRCHAVAEALRRGILS
jgi:LuxR family quorum sensing-dependent transcriptional regulator